MDQEVRGLVALEAGLARVEPEVGDEAVERRDGGEHPRREPFVAREADRLVAWTSEDAGVTVEGGADLAAGAHRLQELGNHLRVRVAPTLPRRVEAVERAAARVAALDPASRHRVGDEVEHLVGPLDRGLRLRRDLRARDPRPDDGEGAAPAAQSFGWVRTMNIT